MFPVTAKQFQLVLIKPSHYDDDGYVIRWWRAMIPSNSLAAIYGIAADCAERRVLGPEVGISIDAIDETHTRVKVPALLARFRRHGNFGLVALVGVQSNQYPRALDIARPFRQVGIPVVIGGFHVSGCLSMLDGHAVDLAACRDMGIALPRRATQRRTGLRPRRCCLTFSLSLATRLFQPLAESFDTRLSQRGSSSEPW
jgi:hypothetical protein